MNHEHGKHDPKHANMGKDAAKPGQDHNSKTEPQADGAGDEAGKPTMGQQRGDRQETAHAKGQSGQKEKEDRSKKADLGVADEQVGNPGHKQDVAKHNQGVGTKH